MSGKAAALRSMQYWMRDVCMNRAYDEHGKMRAAVFVNLVRFDVLCRESERKPSLEQAEGMADAIEAALSCYNWLAAGAMNAKPKAIKLWKVVPKFHMLTHIAYDNAGEVNPRWVHFYSDEDMVGKVKTIYCACHGTTAPLRSLQRYAILQCLRWWAILLEVRKP